MRKFILPLTGLLLIFVGCRLQKARECLEIGDYERAIRLYNIELDKHPRSFEARYGLGLAHYQKANSEEARLNKSIRDWIRSVEELECALRLRSTPILVQNLANACYHLGVAHDLSGNTDQALRDLERALSYRPGHLQAMHRLGSVHYRKGNYSRARSVFQRVLEIDPSYVPAYQNLGSTLWALRRPAEARAIWQAGHNLAPDDEFLQQWISRADQKMQSR